MTIDKFGRHISTVEPKHNHYHVDRENNIDFHGRRLRNIGQPVTLADVVDIEAIINYILYPLYKDINKIYNVKPISRTDFTSKWFDITTQIVNHKNPEILKVFFNEIYKMHEEKP